MTLIESLQRFIIGKPLPVLGQCEGRWWQIFGSGYRCERKATEYSHLAPCRSTHRLCASCVYALERGIGDWDKMGDFLYGCGVGI